ncbi:MAG TPA: hypothetical protein VJG64_04560 [Candidatus Paceibacterota bacterium]
MEEDVRLRLDVLEKKLDAVYASVEKTRKYFLAVVIISVLLFVLPLIGLVFIIPSFINTYSDMGGLLQ